MLRLIVVLLVSGLFGLGCGLLSRSREKNRLYLFAAIAALLGTAGATILQVYQPVLFDHFFSYESWFEWLPFLGSGFTLLFLPRSLILLPLGFAAGFATSRVFASKDQAKSLLPLASFAGVFLLCWYSQAEHLPRGVETRTYVYRFMGEHYSREQSQDWLSFLEWNWSPHMGYEIYSRDDMPRYLQTLLDVKDVILEQPQAAGIDESVFVFVKEYWVNGKRTSYIYTSKSGFKNASELGAFYRNFARSRCSP